MNGLNEIMDWVASRSRGHATGALAFSAIEAIGEVGLLSLHPRHADPLVQDTVYHLAASGHLPDERRASRVVAAVVRWMEGSRRFPWGDDPARYLDDWRASSALRALAAELPGTGLMAEEVYGVLESGTCWLAYQAVKSDTTLWSTLSPDAVDAISFDAAWYLASAGSGSGMSPRQRLNALMLLSSLNPKILPLADSVRQETTLAAPQRPAEEPAAHSTQAVAVSL
ncbi:hypothetical protein GBZ48_18195 [Azospirillum melinis]|uniref:Uncharacterized protein n=1 Tax=Azospirillum melinis TaxID=328839 RepID=A0ABX2KC87_9PROT|nr:hypothetical protein [Azospirillum melinis]MBP2309680.1 hypothetical protein [Azospirillum melinis]NUB01202.1 hypothetical protein [Azospirillum melinis]